MILNVARTLAQSIIFLNLYRIRTCVAEFDLLYPVKRAKAEFRSLFFFLFARHGKNSEKVVFGTEVIELFGKASFHSFPFKTWHPLFSQKQINEMENEVRSYLEKTYLFVITLKGLSKNDVKYVNTSTLLHRS